MDFLIELLFRLLLNVPIVRLIFVAVLPSILLIRYVWKKDRLEPEPPKLVWSLVGLGVVSVLPVMALELGGLAALEHVFKEENFLYLIVHWFLVVGVSEEFCKYMMMRLKTWKCRDFNCFFDAMVYSAAVSAGFALAENLMYGLKYGISVLFVRALVSIPAHICFSVFMGAWYGSAKRFAAAGDLNRARRAHILSVAIPAAAHGAFDLLASNADSTPALAFFLIYVAAMFIFCWRMLKNQAEKDAYFSGGPEEGNRPREA
ncbi:MAG: PrsW family intramembrane metalloprotease [Clostridia bacterium]|nr:PrsW family intramembrane metalloprotease [Clostridia bacterium]